MPFVKLTRPDDNSPVHINIREILSFSAWPEGSAKKRGTRILFRVKTHQDVAESVDEVARRIAGEMGVVAPFGQAPATAVPFDLPPYIGTPPSRLEGYPGYPGTDRLESGAGGPVAQRTEGHPDFKKK